MALADELGRIATAAAAHGTVTGVLAAEPGVGTRRYLVALGEDEERRWLVLDDEAAPVSSRADVRSTASIVAMCELAAELVGDEAAGPPPRVASPSYLDRLGAATSLAELLPGASPLVEEFVRDVERAYALELGQPR